MCADSFVRDESLIIAGEGVEDILEYLMEFSSPVSDLCRKFGPPSRKYFQPPSQ